MSRQGLYRVRIRFSRVQSGTVQVRFRLVSMELKKEFG